MRILTEQAAQDDPPFLLDYWRLNLRGAGRLSLLERIRRSSRR